jgi:hypothetical protein
MEIVNTKTTQNYRSVVSGHVTVGNVSWMLFPGWTGFETFGIRRGVEEAARTCI